MRILKFCVRISPWILTNDPRPQVHAKLGPQSVPSAMTAEPSATFTFYKRRVHLVNSGYNIFANDYECSVHLFTQPHNWLRIEHCSEACQGWLIYEIYSLSIGYCKQWYVMTCSCHASRSRPKPRNRSRLPAGLINSKFVTIIIGIMYKANFVSLAHLLNFNCFCTCLH